MAPSIPRTQTASVFFKHEGAIETKKDWAVTQAKDLKPGEALVRVEYSGVCHTDLHAYKGDWPVDAKLPLVGGHEGAGRIVAIGPYSNTPLKVGDAVGIKWLADSCLECESCRAGYEATCKKAETSGFSVDGSFQQYAVSFTRHLTPIPENVPLEEAAPILCAGVTVYKALKNANCTPGDYVLIAGAGGGLGHLAVQYAVAMNLRVIGIDTGADKEKLVKGYGAHAFIDFTKGDIIEQVKAATDGEGPHAAVIASASADAYNQALEYLRPNGALVAVGLPAKATIHANVFWTVFKSLRIIGSYVGNRQDAIEALEFASQNKVKPQIVVEPLENLESVYTRMEKGQLAGRIVLKI